MLAALSASTLYPSIFVSMTFATGTVYVWSGIGTISWNGHSWQGVGSLGSITTIEESGTVEAKGLTLTLSGIDAGLLADDLQEFQSGGAAVIYVGLWDITVSPAALIADPLTSWAGRMDFPVVEISGDSAVISIVCESRLLEMQVPNQLYYDQDTQQALFPGDLGMTFVAGCQGANISWGAHPTSSPI